MPGRECTYCTLRIFLGIFWIQLAKLACTYVRTVYRWILVVMILYIIFVRKTVSVSFMDLLDGWILKIHSRYSTYTTLRKSYDFGAHKIRPGSLKRPRNTKLMYDAKLAPIREPRGPQIVGARCSNRNRTLTETNLRPADFFRSRLLRCATRLS